MAARRLGVAKNDEMGFGLLHGIEHNARLTMEQTSVDMFLGGQFQIDAATPPICRINSVPCRIRTRKCGIKRLTANNSETALLGNFDLIDVDLGLQAFP